MDSDDDICCAEDTGVAVYDGAMFEPVDTDTNSDTDSSDAPHADDKQWKLWTTDEDVLEWFVIIHCTIPQWK